MLLDKVATLEEIERHWSIMDVLNAIDVLDAVQAAERLLRERERARVKK